MAKPENPEKERKQEKQENKQESKRKIITPGETIVSGSEYLPGDGTKREGNNIIATRFGLAEESGRLVRVIPLSGVYSARRGNVIIGRVADATFNGWIIDINAPYLAFLSVNECPKFVNKNDLTEYIDIGKMVSAKVFSVKRRSIDLTIRGKGLGKLEEGMTIYINPSKVPRVIGKEGSMVNLIKNETGCHITVGQNGVVWLRGRSVSDELFAKEAIMFVAKKSFIEGLTDKVKEFLDKKKEK